MIASAWQLKHMSEQVLRKILMSDERDHVGLACYGLKLSQDIRRPFFEAAVFPGFTATIPGFALQFLRPLEDRTLHLKRRMLASEHWCKSSCWTAVQTATLVCLDQAVNAQSKCLSKWCGGLDRSGGQAGIEMGDPPIKLVASGPFCQS